MGKHRKPDEDESISGELPDTSGPLKEQLAERAPKGDGIGESSLSPIETW